MPASIVVNQATRPAGTAGKARSDGVVAQLVTCTNNTVETTYLWTLIDAPIRSALVRGTTGSGASFTFTPDVKGTYLVSLRVNGSAAPGDNDSSYIAVRSIGGKSLGWRYQSASETQEDNETYAGLGFPSNVNPRGWATNDDLIFEEIEEAIWDVENAISVFGGVQERLVKTDPATGKIAPSLVAGTPPIGPASGDLSGSFPGPSVVALRGRAITNVLNPMDGQALVWDSAGTAWKAANIAVSAGLGGISAGTNQATSGNVILSNSNNVSFGMDTSGVVTASANGAIAISAGTQSANNGTVVLSNSNGLTFGMSAGTITGSYTTPSTAGLLSRINVSGGTTSNNLTNVVFSDSNNVSFGLSGSTLTASASYSQSTGPSAFAAGSQTGTSGTLAFADSNGISFGLSGSSQLTASYTVPSTAGLISRVNVSAGTTSNNMTNITFADGNNVSFGLNGSTLTASVATSLTAINISGGISSNNVTQIKFSNSNNVSFGVGNGGGSNVVTASVPSGASATGNFGALAAGTQTATSGTVTLANSNGITFGMSGSNQITASYTVPSTAGLLSAVNVSAGSTSNNLSALTFSNGSGVSFGLNASTVTASVAAGATATGNLGGLSFMGATANTLYTSGTVSFPDSGQITWSTNAGAVAAIAKMKLTAGTTGTAWNNLQFDDAGGVSFGVSSMNTNGFVTLTASAASGATATGNFGAVAGGTQTATSGTVVFSNSNNISFGLSGSSQMTATVAAVAVSFPGAGAASLYSGGTVTFPDTAFVSWKTQGGSIAPEVYVQFAVPGTTNSLSRVVFSNSNNMSFGINAGTITASFIGPFLSTFEPYPMGVNTATGVLDMGTNTSNGMSLFPFQIDDYVSAENLRVIVSMNFTTSGAVENWSQSGSLQWGLLTRLTGTNSTRMSNLTSSSLSYAVSWNNSTISVKQATTTNASGVYSTAQTTSAGVNITSQYTGLKMMLLGLNATLAPGQYWLGIHHRQSSSSIAARGIQMSLVGMQVTQTVLAPMGSLSSAYSTGSNIPLDIGGNWHLGHASYTVAGMTQLTSDVTMSQMTQNLTVMPYMKFATRV